MSTIRMEASADIDKAGVSFTVDGDEWHRVSAVDLKANGWEYEPACDLAHCEDGECLPCPYCDDGNSLPVVMVVERWHNDEAGHAGVFRFCDEEPCRGIRKAQEL